MPDAIWPPCLSSEVGQTGNILESLPSNERMKTVLLIVLGSSLLTLPLLLGADGSNDSKSGATSEAERLVEQMRGISMQPAAAPRSDGTIDPREQRRQEIVDGLRALGGDAVPALVHALKESDVQMRRNAELVMISLAAPYEGKQRVDIQKAMPGLIKATEDPDGDVRAWERMPLPRSAPKQRRQ